MKEIRKKVFRVFSKEDKDQVILDLFHAERYDELYYNCHINGKKINLFINFYFGFPVINVEYKDGDVERYAVYFSPDDDIPFINHFTNTTDSQKLFEEAGLDFSKCLEDINQFEIRNPKDPKILDVSDIRKSLLEIFDRISDNLSEILSSKENATEDATKAEEQLFKTNISIYRTIVSRMNNEFIFNYYDEIDRYDNTGNKISKITLNSVYAYKNGICSKIIIPGVDKVLEPLVVNNQVIWVNKKDVVTYTLQPDGINIKSYETMDGKITEFEYEQNGKIKAQILRDLNEVHICDYYTYYI